MPQKLPFRWNRHGAFEGCPFDSRDIEELISSCPAAFRENNPWSEYARKAIDAGKVDTSNWKWKSEDKEVREEQFAILNAFVHEFIPRENKLAVAGWMFSEMLLKVLE